MPRDDRTAVAGAAAADVLCVLVFCAVGRRNHAEGITVAGVVETAWPFLAGTTFGWLAARAWRRPTTLAPAGIVIWLSTVVVGMLLRKATSAGTAFSFVVVASLSTAILLLGWRLGARVLARR
jgi:peptidoglycan/LPS O-acetylase OafA/YrhL